MSLFFTSLNPRIVLETTINAPRYLVHQMALNWFAFSAISTSPISLHLKVCLLGNHRPWRHRNLAHSYFKVSSTNRLRIIQFQFLPASQGNLEKIAVFFSRVNAAGKVRSAYLDYRVPCFNGSTSALWQMSLGGNELCVCHPALYLPRTGTWLVRWYWW
jgi:hypothetical protein